VCTVGTIGWLAGDENVGGRGNVVTSWGRIGGGESGFEWAERVVWVRRIDCSTRKGEKVKGVRIGIGNCNGKVNNLKKKVQQQQKV
jgi:hypothetical protein